MIILPLVNKYTLKFYFYFPTVLFYVIDSSETIICINTGNVKCFYSVICPLLPHSYDFLVTVSYVIHLPILNVQPIQWNSQEVLRKWFEPKSNIP